MIHAIKVITAKAISKNVLQGQRNNFTLSKGVTFKIDKEVFEAFEGKEVPYIHICTTKDWLKHMAIDSKNQTFIKYDDVIGSNHKWKISYDKNSLSCKLVSVNEKNQNGYNAFAYFEPFKFSCIIDEN